jgi:hypothetical protein
MEATAFRVSERIGPNMAWTDEKFLVCYAVPISRTGVLIYGAAERPEVQPGPDGLIRIERNAEDVFAEESIKSLQGKPLLNEHPVFDVNPENYQGLTVGTVINPRRGEGVYDDCVVADVVVMDKAAIEDVLSDKREVSGGYDCKYFDLGEGRGRQTNIIFNHVALVESGRCGPRCSIKDHAMREEPSMSKTNTKHPWLDKLRTLGSSLTADKKATFDEAVEEAEREAKTKDEEEVEERERDKTKDAEDLSKRMDELEAKHATHDAKFRTHDAKLRTHDADIAELKEKMSGKKDEEEESHDADKEEGDKEIEGELKEEAPPGTGDRAAKAKDSAYLAPTWQATKALAEILVPGIRIPTFDGKGDPKVTYRGICDFRRRALGLALLTTDGSQIVADVRGGRPLTSDDLGALRCNEVRQLFYSAGAAKKAANTRDMQHPGQYVNTEGSGGGVGVTSRMKTPAEINEENRKRYGAGAK